MALEKYTAKEIPTSTKFNTMVDAVNDNTTKLSQIEQNVGELVGNKATALTDGKIEGGKVYTISLSEADDTLTIDSIEVSDYESVIYLSIGDDVEEPVSLPDSYKSIGVPAFEAGKSYVIGVLNGIIIANEITEN